MSYSRLCSALAINVFWLCVIYSLNKNTIHTQSSLKYNNRHRNNIFYNNLKCRVTLHDYQTKYVKIIISNFKKWLVTSTIMASSILPLPRQVNKLSQESQITKEHLKSDRYLKGDSLSIDKKNKMDISMSNKIIQSKPSPKQNDQSNELRQFGTSFVRDAVKVIGPSVVRIDCEREIQSIASLFSNSPSDQTEVVKVSGSGIIMSEDGYIVTNAHVVQDARKTTITLSNGRTFKVNVVGYDEFTDLAVLKADIHFNNHEKKLLQQHQNPIDSNSNDDSSNHVETPYVPTVTKLLPAPLGDSSCLQSGDWVVAVGCPVGLDFTVTLGIVSNPKRSAIEVGAPFLKGFELVFYVSLICQYNFYYFSRQLYTNGCCVKQWKLWWAVDQ